MKSIIENKNEFVAQKNVYEEIADIPEAIAEGMDIDGEENFSEDSVMELDLKDYEELGVHNIGSIKSMTIIDELESDSTGKNTLSNDKESINIEKLTIKIDGLTSVQKRNKVKTSFKKIILPSPEKETEIQTDIEKKVKDQDKKEITQIVEELRHELKHEVRQEVKLEVKQEVKEKVKQEIREKLKQEIREKLKQEIRQEKADLIDRKLEKKEEERQQEERKEERKEENYPAKAEAQQIQTENINIKKPDTELPKEIIYHDPENIIKSAKGNTLTIEIPDKLFGDLPANFNIDELGTIDLDEAEIIADENILSWANGDMLEELEDIDILTEKNKTAAKNKQKSEQIKKPTKIPGKETVELLKEVNTDKQKTEEKTAETEILIQPQDTTENEKDIQEKKVAFSEIDVINEEPRNEKAEEETKEKIDNKYQLPAEEIITEKETIEIKSDLISEKNDAMPTNLSLESDKETQSLQDIFGIEIKDENVFIIENENINSKKNAMSFSGIDELEDITSSIVDVVEGKAKQLTESDIIDRKAITGLIRDNYPTFKDLLKEKEFGKKQVHTDDDIAFVDNSILTKDQKARITEFKNPLKDIIRTKTAAPFQQMLGLAADEFDLIENQLFKIKTREIDLDKTASIKPGLDQHPSDTIALDKYTYILPTPGSLLDNEKKSIEDDISTSSALIYEEDVDKIKKKLEASMKKKIEETIQDITDKITIYEDNKTRNNSIESDVKGKDEIKILLQYLNDLFEKLPKETIETFANSEYYELYKKVLKEMDI